MLSISKLKSIIGTLPISYYLKSNIKVNLSETEDSSYINFVTDEITISLPSLNNRKYDLNTTDEEYEADIRCMLYHEISHAILTPFFKEFTCSAAQSDILNIFEDERIETILRNYYKGVDFKNFVKKVNNYEPNRKVTSARDLFYNIVRFNEGPSNFIKKTYDIIEKYSDINSNVHCGYKESDNYQAKYSKYYYYSNEVFNFYNEIEKYFNANHNTINESNSTDQSSSDVSLDLIGCNNNGITNDKEFNINNIKINIKLNIDAVLTSITQYKDEHFRNEIAKIIYSKSGKEKINSGKKIGYSGRLNPRLIANNNYKWFVNGDGSTIKEKDKGNIHFNLFIDNSGSFTKSTQVVNNMIAELGKIEQSNKRFTFDIITINTNVKELPKKDRFIHCRGGNRLKPELIDVYNNHNNKPSGTNVTNIVLFDGYAASYDDETEEKNARCWDNKNCIIISDYSNNFFKYVCPNAKVTFIYDNYAEKLIDTVLDTLRQKL